MVLKTIARMGVVAGLTVASLAGTMPSTYANEAGAVAAGVIGGAALGALAGSAAAGAYGPRYYAPPPPPGYYAPVDAPPPRCHREFVRVWDPYAGVYVEHPRRICDY